MNKKKLIEETIEEIGLTDTSFKIVTEKMEEHFKNNKDSVAIEYLRVLLYIWDFRIDADRTAFKLLHILE